MFRYPLEPAKKESKSTAAEKKERFFVVCTCVCLNDTACHLCMFFFWPAHFVSHVWWKLFIFFSDCFIEIDSKNVGRHNFQNNLLPQNMPVHTQRERSIILIKKELIKQNHTGFYVTRVYLAGIFFYYYFVHSPVNLFLSHAAAHLKIRSQSKRLLFRIRHERCGNCLIK